MMLTGYLFDPLTDERYPLDEPRWRSDSGGVLSLAIPGFWNPDELCHREHSIWRYREAFPIQDEQNIVTMGEGFTPLLNWNRRGMNIWIKQEHLFPTGSYKDRGAAVLISKVKELGIRQVVQDSSGNAGCAIAAYCGRAGIACDIYVPADTSPAKLMQISSYGARMHLIPGSREDTAAAALDAARNIYYASHCWNPFFLHGTKTFAYEIWEQLGQRGPDALVLPVGNGTLLLGAYIGFTDLIQRGLIDKLPKLIGVQSGHCAPLATAFQQHATQPALIEKLPTLAEGIAIATPVRGAEILAAVRDSGGYFITVDETEILSTHRALALQGFYVELTAAAAIAGLDHYLELVVETETIVSVFTGHGLKSACEH